MRYAGFDCHCHLDLYTDSDKVGRDLSEAAVKTIAVTTTPRAFERNVQKFAYSPYIEVGLGIHPELANTCEADLDLFRELLPKSNVVGEIGLDQRFQNRATFNQQVTVFESVIDAVKQANRQRLMSIHSAQAVTPVLDRLEHLVPGGNITIIMHWFTGSMAELERAAALGCFFSVNASMLKSERGRKLVQRMSANRILTETDGPFIKIDGRPAVPSDVLELALLIAREKGLTLREASEMLLRNAAEVGLAS